MPRPPKYDHKQIWQMAFIDGLTPAEIAEKLAVPDARQVRKILWARAEEVIKPERPGR